MDPECVEQQLERFRITAREKCLLDLSFDGETTDEVFHTVVDGLDLDTENQNYLLMLSSLGFSKGWKWFPPEMVPRLKGLHRYHQAHVSIGIPWLVGQIRVLANEGIPAMLLKGAAMVAYYAPGRPRIIFDYDIAVREKHFDRALELLLQNGNTLGQRSPDSVGVRGDCDSIKLHRWIFEPHDDRLSDVWEHAVLFPLHGIDMRVPTQEDMFLLLMDPRSSSCSILERTTSRLRWLFDCLDIWNYSSKLSLERLSFRAKKLRITSRVRMMLGAFGQCFPESFELEEFERFFPRTQKCNRLLAEDA